jgi:hypothetical protein
MARPLTRLALAAALAACAAAPALAGTSASSAVSDSLSTSIGTSSDSVRGSSRASSGQPPVAAGDYKVIEVAAVAERPGRVALVMQSAGGESVTLEVPQQTLAKTPVVAGQTLTVRERPYGVEFVLAPTQQVFFLVLDDAWHRELESRPVVL